MKKVLVLEEVTEKGSEWGISFTDHNPEAKDYFKMPDAETAQRLKSYLAEYASQQAQASTPPVSAMEDGLKEVIDACVRYRNTELDKHCGSSGLNFAINTMQELLASLTTPTK